jgi:hypothetical protein
MSLRHRFQADDEFQTALYVISTAYYTPGLKVACSSTDHSQPNFTDGHVRRDYHSTPPNDFMALHGGVLKLYVPQLITHSPLLPR